MATMAAVKKNLLIEKGATFSFRAVWKDKTTGTPINLTGYSGRMHVKRAASDKSALLEITTANGRMTLGGSAGTIALHVSDTITSALPAVSGVYDIELVSGSGDVYRLIQGAVTIDDEVTR